MELKKLAREIHENASEKGFYEEIQQLMEHPHLSEKEKKFIQFLWRSNRLLLIIGELSEAHEGLRKDNLSGEPGSGGMLEELADAEIRILDFVEDEKYFNPDQFEKAIERKHEFNRKRPRKHGKIA